jgi:two-component system cell cycle sensor histidine kinase/response regulator CckA
MMPGVKEFGGGRMVLVAEDDTMVRRFVRFLLTQMGFEVMDAETGEAALSLSREYLGDIALLLTNVRMPGMQGPELARIIARERPNTKTLIMSAYTTAELDAISTGNEFLCKPFLPEVFRAKVREVLTSPETEPLEI